MREAVMCRRFLGYIGRTLEFYGKVPQKDHKLCRARGDSVCLFSFDWQLAHDVPLGWKQPSLSEIIDILNELRALPDLESLSAAIIDIVHDHLSYPWVELWIRPIGSGELTLVRRAGTRTGEQVARIDLQLAGRDVGRLNIATGAGSRQDILDALVPWFSLLIDTARLSGKEKTPAQHIEDFLQAARAQWGFSPRERDVLRLVLQGESNKSIAKTLGCEERTVEQHMTNLLHKTGAKTRGMLVWWVWKKVCVR
jgi:DNA-binding CsgD family transcriptional regulator